jgi:hypothetical protein
LIVISKGAVEGFMRERTFSSFIRHRRKERCYWSDEPPWSNS